MITRMAQKFSRWAVALATVGVLMAAGPLARAQSADDSGWQIGQDSSDSAQPAPDAQPSDNARPKPASGSAKAVASTQYRDRDPSALTTFRPALDPYGHWVSDPTYGLVWVPSARYVGSDFAPYVTSGHWGLTAAGDWIWVSDLPFGWAVFHYGRWVWVGGTGWAWIPGRRYSNAWVVWRVPDDGYDYIGWAPMPPTWGWYDGVAVSLWFGPPVPYVFCESDYVFYPHVYRHIVHHRHDIDRIAHHSSRWHGPHGHGPSPHRAHVPPRAVPRHHTPANPRAVAASHPSPYRISGQRSRPAPRPTTAHRTVPHRLGSSRTLSARRPKGSTSRTLSGRSFAGSRAAVPSRSLRTMRPAPARMRPAARAPTRVRGRTYYRPAVRSSRSYRAAPSRSYRSSPSLGWSSHYSRSYTPFRSSSSSSSSYRPSPARSFTGHRSTPHFHSFSPPAMHFHSAGRGGFHGRR